MHDGVIIADGSPIIIEQLQPALQQLTKEKGFVYYYRESGQEEPHPNAMKVIAAIADSKLPISFSSKPDFSDYIGGDGQSHIRTSQETPH